MLEILLFDTGVKSQSTPVSKNIIVTDIETIDI